MLTTATGNMQELRKTLYADKCYTFKPTAAQIRDFETFLATVEGLSGRKFGYARVKMPEARYGMSCSISAQPWLIKLAWLQGLKIWPTI